MIAPTLSGIPPFLIEQPRWLLWREVQRNGKKTKEPRTARNRAASTTDAHTWAPFTEIAAVLEKQPKLFDGFGFTLGNLENGEHSCGIDFDSCLDEHGDVVEWAQPIIDVTGTYTYIEVSPSETGLKAFFRCKADDAKALREAFGVAADNWGCKRTVGLNAKDHGPAIEVYLGPGRYFTVTGRHWATAPEDVALLDRTSLLRVAELVRKATGAASAWSEDRSDGRDNSRSGIAFRKGAALRRQGKTFDEMCAALRAEPETADWCREKGDAHNGRELKRIWDRAAEKAERPAILVIDGQRHAAADAGIAALRGAAIYQRGPNIVRCASLQGKTSQGAVTSTPGIVPVCQAYLERELSIAADWFRPKKDGTQRQIDPPNAVAAQILAMQGLWPFPLLTGVIGTPTMRPDGSLLLAEGYDEQTGYFLLSPPEMPNITDRPTRDQAKRALDLLDDLLAEFPFVDDASRSVALSMVMTPVLRAAMSAAPCHAASAPEPGTGKSYLQDVAAMVATGDLCPVISMTKGNAEECEKRLIGCTLSGHPIIALDNMTIPLQGDFLCQLTERPRLRPRTLGSSDMTNTIPNGFTVFANGQNLRVADDMAARRTLKAGLDANMEDTTARKFSQPTPTQKIAANRGDYVAAVLTIARAYIVAGMPKLDTLPSYDDWCRFVRSPLIWLGRDDPAETMREIRETDPVRTQRLRVFTEWKTALGAVKLQSKILPPDGYTTKELIDKANSTPDLREVLLEVAAAARAPTEIDPRALGYWLRGAKDTRIAGLKLIQNKFADKYRPRWLLVQG